MCEVTSGEGSECLHGVLYRHDPDVRSEHLPGEDVVVLDVDARSAADHEVDVLRRDAEARAASS